MTTVGKSTQIYSAFHPSLVGPIYAWYDSADTSTLSLSGTTLRFWLDKSGNNFTLSGGFTRPLGGGDAGAPVYDSVVPSLSSAIPSTVRFAGAGMVASSLSLGGTEPFSVAIVSKYNATLNTAAVFFGVNASSASNVSLSGMYFHTGVSADTIAANSGYYYWGALPTNRRGNGIKPEGRFINAQMNRNWNVFMMTWGATCNTIIEAGVMSGSNLAASVTALVPTRTAAFYVGRIPLDIALDGNIAELILYRGLFTDRQKSALAWYLTRKWNLSQTGFTQNPYTADIQPFIRPFHPYDISGLVRWYDAADPTTITLCANPIRILSWFNKSRFTANISSLESQFPFAGSTGIFFNSTGNLGNSRSTITISGSVGFNETIAIEQGGIGGCNLYQSLVLYAQPRVLTGGGAGFGIQRNLNQAGTSQSLGSLGVRLIGLSGINAVRVGDGAGLSISVTVPTANPRLIIATESYASSLNLYQNGTTLSESTRQAVGANDSNRFFISSTAITGFTEIGEILAYSSMLGYTERSKLEGYLAWKWGQTANLPNTHPYKTSIPYEVSYPVSPTTEVAFWFDAADTNTLVLSGTQVLRWSNKAPFSNFGFGPRFLSYGGGTVRTFAFSQNNLNVITFGSNGYLSASGGNASYSTNTRTYAFVARVQSSLSTNASAARIINRPSISGELLFLSKNTVSTTTMYMTFSGLGLAFTTGVLPTSNLELSTQGFFIGTMIATGSTNVARVRYNGSNCVGGTSLGASTIIGAGAVLPPLVIGGVNATGQRSVSFDLCELIQFNSTRVLEDVVRIEGYLAWKWGLRSVLPPLHPFKVYPP